MKKIIFYISILMFFVGNLFGQPVTQTCPISFGVAPVVKSVTAEIHWIVYAPDLNALRGKIYSLKYRLKGSNAAWKEVTSSATPNSGEERGYFFINGLTPNTTYEYDMPCSSSTNGGEDLGMIKQFTTLPCADIKTVKAVITTLTQTTAQIVGATMNGGTYVLQYRPKGTSTWIMVTRTANSNSMTFDIANLKPATTYEYALRATCSVFYDFLTEFTTQGASLCTAPPPTTPLMITKNSDGYFFSSINSYNLEYEIKYHIQGANTWETRTFTPNSIRQLAWQPKTVYEYQIRLKCVPTYSAYSALWTYMAN